MNIEETKNRFGEGTVCYHKATNDRCVVISITDKGVVLVRTEKNLKSEYYPQELETENERNARYSSQLPPNKFDGLDPYGL